MTPDVVPADSFMKRDASVAVIGAGDFIGAAIARRFAAGGYRVFAGRRNGEKLQPLVDEIEAAGGRCVGRTLDARDEKSVTDFLAEADAAAPLDLVIFNVGANVNFPILETTERVFRKVWEMACYSGFLTGREAARIMLSRGRGSIFFTGATASLRGGAGFAAFASASRPKPEVSVTKIRSCCRSPSTTAARPTSSTRPRVWPASLGPGISMSPI